MQIMSSAHNPTLLLQIKDSYRKATAVLLSYWRPLRIMGMHHCRST
jgi:hypothetical protein